MLFFQATGILPFNFIFSSVSWALFSLVFFFFFYYFSCLSSLLIPWHTSSWGLVEPVSVRTVCLNSSISPPYYMSLLTCPLNMKKLSGFLSWLLIIFNIFTYSHIKCCPDGTLLCARLKYLVPCLSPHLILKSRSSLCPTFITLSWLINLLSFFFFLEVCHSSQCWQQSHHYNQVSSSFYFLFICSCLFADLCNPWEMCICFPVVLLWTLQQNNPL